MTTRRQPGQRGGRHREGAATVSEPECRRLMRRLWIASPEEWMLWSRANGLARRRLYVPTRPAKEYDNPRFWTEYSGQYPHHWAEFHRGRTRHDDEPTRQELARWARYASRYKAASSYRGIRFSGMKDASARGYSAALGVFLAYSALEACWAAMGSRAPKDRGLIDLELAKNVRAALGGRFELAGELHENLRANVARFMKADDESDWPRSQDILIMARAIRHLVAHGIFTPWGGRTVSLKAASAFQDLADAVLENSSQLFSKHVWPEILAGRAEELR